MVEMRTFVGGGDGEWDVVGCQPVVGEGLTTPSRLAVLRDGATLPVTSGDDVSWVLRGVGSHLRYTTAAEQDALLPVSPPLGRPQATRAALIPISKSPRWWGLAQDERRALLEEHSHHIAVGLRRLPAIARELSHSRDLEEPFDFLTWFEYAPDDAAAFEELVATLRASPEWEFVDREVDVRLQRRVPVAGD